MSKYYALLNELGIKVEHFRSSTAEEYILKMYRALRNVTLNLTPDDES